MGCSMLHGRVIIHILVCASFGFVFAFGSLYCPHRLQDAFKELQHPKEIYLAITTEDASIVYYKISQGIVKPPV
jgi:hypothetical protein